MSEIEYIRFDDPATIELLSSSFSDRSLVPVIGAGFTRGCLTERGARVPSGVEFQEQMIEIICAANDFDESKKDKLKERTFSQVSDVFFNEKFVSKEVVDKHLEKSFLGVRLDKQKLSFINDIEWPYIYTLNADDAIERNSDFMVALPYEKSLTDKAKDYPTLFKLHGDINYELRHSESRLVFKKGDYLKSLSANKTMLELFKLDMINKNIIYIGCSLSDELDIASLVAQENINNKKSTKNIVFLDSELDILDEQEYISLGINCVILYDKGQYSQIYETLFNAFQNSTEKSSELDVYKSKIISLDSEHEKNKRIFVEGIVSLNNTKKSSNSVIPYYYSSRDIKDKVVASLYKNEVTFIKGKRVSGKTLLALDVLNSIKDKQIFTISSSTRIDIKALKKLLGTKNSILFFDHGSLDIDGYRLIQENRNQLSNNKTSILICTNENGNDAEYYLNMFGSNTGSVSLASEFSPSEMKEINIRSIECKLPTFTEGKYIFDKIYSVFQIIGEDRIISSIKKTEDLFALLYVVAVRHSITGEEIHFSGLEKQRVLEIAKERSPFLQLERIDYHEQTDHTNYKITSYANSWVVALLRDYFREKGVEWCSDVLIRLFKNAYSNSKSFVTELRKFDSINFVFTSNQNGAGALILDIYEKLQVVEGKEPEFYVQKSKAYYNMYHGKDLVEKLSHCIRELNTAYTWAKTNNNIKNQQNILHVKALLCLKKVVNSGKYETNDIIETINAIYQTMNEDGNASYNNELFKGKRTSSKLLKQFMDVIDQCRDVQLLLEKNKISEIKSKLELYR